MVKAASRLERSMNIKKKEVSKRSLVIIAIFFISFVILLIFMKYIGFGIDLAKGVTQEKLLSIAPGMTKTEVIGKIGKPLAITNDNNIETFVYGSPDLLENGLELYVKFDKGKVNLILAEHHDLGVYWYKIGKKPIIKSQKLLDFLNP